ncbi:MAG: hypothetical protein QGF67_01420 [Lentisphaeria bacterium]|jgi:L-fucose isomerase-like protein|nr:hypothetical protein [Lentisphaeria bacterium]
MAAANMKIGFIPANRGFFSSELAAAMRSETIDVMRQLALDPVVLEDGQSNLGCVETRQEAEACAQLFREQEVEGIVIGAVNFGDEQAAALAVKQAGLNVPVLIFGCQEEHALTPGMSRRDAFCGLLSIGEALRQIGFTYSVGQRPVCFPSDQAFRDDLDWFVRVCRVVNGIRKARYGQIGARPDAFWTCRFDEKRLQRLGPTTVTLDLSEVFGGVRAISDDDAEVRGLIESIADYADSSKMAEAGGKRSRRVRCAVLDQYPTPLRCLRLHHHEPFHRYAHPGSLRSGYHRHALDACAAIGQRQTRCPGRLEQSAQ